MRARRAAWAAVRPTRARAGAALGLALAVAALHGQGAARDRERPRLVLQSDRFAPPDHIEDRDDSLKLGITDIGNMRFVVSNAGTFGRAFDSRQNPSMEWPARSGFDHLVRGALWVGAISVTTGDTLVTTGGRDANYLEPIFQHSEFSPIHPEAPEEFSRLRSSPHYRAGTVSDENLRTVYVDTLHVVKTGPGEEQHTPMGIRIIQNTYGWGFDPVDDFVIVEVNVVNVTETALQDVWIGIYTELVTNNRNYYRNWPPGGIWFDFQDPEWDDAERLLLNRRNAPEGFVTGATQWSGIKVLGSGGRGPYDRGPDSISTKQLTLTGWSWSPTRFLNGTWNDDSLYTFMSRGRTDVPPEIFDSPLDTGVNPVSIVAAGPFNLLAPRDTVQVVFAFLAGQDEQELRTNASWAQKAYNDRYALPSPPGSPILRVFPQHRSVVLRWSDHSESEPDPASKLFDFQGYRIYLSESALASQFHLVQQFDKDGDGIGFDTGMEGIRRPEPYITTEGDTLVYELRLDGIPDGFKRYASVTAFDYQDGEPRSLEGGVLPNSVYFISGPSAAEAEAGGYRVSVFPNPYRGESSFDGWNPATPGEPPTINPRKRVLWFVNLPPRAQIRIYTLAGDRVREYAFDAATYTGVETDGISPDRSDLAVGRNLVTGGSMAGFDLLNSDGQEIASGLYLFTVENLDTGEAQQGKFMVIR